MRYVRLSARSLSSEAVTIRPMPMDENPALFESKGPLGVLEGIVGAVHRFFTTESNNAVPATIIKGPWPGSGSFAIDLRPTSASTPGIVPLWVDASPGAEPSPRAKALLQSFNNSVAAAVEDHIRSGRAEGVFENGELIDIRPKR
jgi:hypothetical protein